MELQIAYAVVRSFWLDVTYYAGAILLSEPVKYQMADLVMGTCFKAGSRRGGLRTDRGFCRLLLVGPIYVDAMRPTSGRVNDFFQDWGVPATSWSACLSILTTQRVFRSTSVFRRTR